MRSLLLIAAFGLLFAGAGRARAEENVLRVVVSGVTSSRGHVRVEICPAKDFLKDCPYGGAAPSTLGTTVVMIRGVPPGVYAAQVYQDKNDNNTVDRDFLGIPSEGVGFSNDAPIRMRAPSFRAAAFTYAGGESSISLRLRHFIN